MSLSNPTDLHTEGFERELYDYFDTRLPAKIYDAHVHLSRTQMKRRGIDEAPHDFFIKFTEAYLPRNLSGAMVMPQIDLHTEETLADDNRYNLAIAKRENYDAGLIVRPVCGREKVEGYLDTNPEIKVLKPYSIYAENVQNSEETDIDTFAPDWLWQLANDREMPILLHLSHYRLLLSDPRNYEQIIHFCTKYPRAKLVLAHCAMGHNVERLRRGLEKIKDLKNIWFDCSGAGEVAAIAYCIKAFGTERMMYGGDFEYGMSYGRIFSYGGSWHAYRPSEPKPTYSPSNNLQDCLLQLFYAIDAMSLSDKAVEDIFYYNAKKLYGQPRKY